MGQNSNSPNVHLFILSIFDSQIVIFYNQLRCHILQVILIILLSLVLIIISGLVAAVCFLKWNKIKKEFFKVTSQAPLIEEKEKEETEPLSKVEIPVPPPLPPPVEIGSLFINLIKPLNISHI